MSMNALYPPFSQLEKTTSPISASSVVHRRQEPMGFIKLIESSRNQPPPIAEQELVTPGLRAGHYLGFFGMHVFTGDIMDSIGQLLDSQNGMSSQRCLTQIAMLLTTAVNTWRIVWTERDRTSEFDTVCSRLNLPLDSVVKIRDEILVELIDLLANRADAGDVPHEFSDRHHSFERERRSKPLTRFGMFQRKPGNTPCPLSGFGSFPATGRQSVPSCSRSLFPVSYLPLPSAKTAQRDTVGVHPLHRIRALTFTTFH